MGGTRSPQLLKMSKAIWNYLLSHQITITAEYLPNRLNVRADWECVQECNRLIRVETSSESLSENNQTLRNPNSRSFCLQTVSPTSPIHGMDARSKQFRNSFGFAFPPFSLIGRVISKVFRENAEAMILVTPTWQTQPWYTLLLRMSMQRPLLLPAHPNLLLNPLGEKFPLVKTRSLRLAAWKITGKPWKSKEFQAVQPNLSPCPGDQVQLQVANRPGTSGLAGVVDNKLIVRL